MKSNMLTTAFLCLGALLLFVVGTMMVSPIVAALALGVFFFVAHLFSYPRILITLTLVYVSFSNLPRGYMSTMPFTVVLIFFFLAITFFLIMEKVLKHGAVKQSLEEITIRKIAIYLLFITALSIAFHNLTQIKVWFRFIYMYMLQVPVLVYCLRHVKAGDFRKLFKYLNFLFIVQIILNGTWFLSINPLPNIRPLYQDFAYGTLQSCRFVALFSLSMFAVYISTFDNPHSKRWKWLSVILAGLCLVQFYFTYTNHMFLTAAILILLIGIPLLRTMKRKMFWISAGLISGAIFIGIFISFFENDKVGDGMFDELLSKKSLSWRYDLLRNGPKGESYRVTFSELHGHSPISWLVGVGPGMYMSKPAFIYVTPLALKYMGNYYLSQENAKFVGRGGINVVPMFGMGVLFGELGILGAAAFLAFYLYPVIRVMRQLMRGEYTDRLQSAMARGFICFVVLFLLENLAFDWLSDQFSQVLFAVWAASVWVPDGKRKSGTTGGAEPAHDTPEETLISQKELPRPRGR